MAEVHSLFLLRLAGLCRTTLASAGLPADSLEEMRQIDVKNAGDLAQGADTDVLLAAFDGAGKGAAESGAVGEIFLPFAKVKRIYSFGLLSIPVMV